MINSHPSAPHVADRGTAPRYSGYLRISNKQCRTKIQVALGQGIVPVSLPIRDT